MGVIAGVLAVIDRPWEGSTVSADKVPLKDVVDLIQRGVDKNCLLCHICCAAKKIC